MTTIYHGYTQDEKPQLANKAQLVALLELLVSEPRSELRDKAVDALDNAIDCLTNYAAWQEAEETKADAQERADLYEMGMGR